MISLNVHLAGTTLGCFSEVDQPPAAVFRSGHFCTFFFGCHSSGKKQRAWPFAGRVAAMYVRSVWRLAPCLVCARVCVCTVCVCGQNTCCFETYCTLPAQQVLEIVDNPELLSQQISALLSDPMVVDEVRQAPVRRAWVLGVSSVDV